MDKPRIKFPSNAQWVHYKQNLKQGIDLESLRGNIKTWCIHCQLPVELSGSFTIRIGSLVKMSYTEEVMINGTVFEELKSRVIPVHISGHGCIDCHNLMRRLDGEELAGRNRYIESKGTHQDKRKTWIDVRERILGGTP